ncbi:hypothetical protein HELRODRAFT_168508 [Helobdella robusta]|uniref:Aquaporin n=1 Tax=Helobdella robusta TaxID=6412 RepID=T1F0N2_HELRO|nr:hypothetical protein HELRODRAFT_168508 [Helobdella robusta]ESO09516.1 hypothetical protein HELRODRAFT_168508 [Helobdella robusta]
MEIKNYFEWSLDDLARPSFWTECACEMLVTFILLSTMTLVASVSEQDANPASTVHVCFYLARFMYVAYEGYGAIGCCVSPVVTFSILLAREISLAKILLAEDSELPMVDPGRSGLKIWQATTVEGLYSQNTVLPSLAVSITVAFGILGTARHTGGFMNPLIPFAFAVFHGNVKNQWIYWLGPYIGGTLAVLTYGQMLKGRKYKPKFKQTQTTQNPDRLRKSFSQGNVSQR